jgi:hypothetical protein
MREPSMLSVTLIPMFAVICDLHPLSCQMSTKEVNLQVFDLDIGWTLTLATLLLVKDLLQALPIEEEDDGILQPIWT